MNVKAIENLREKIKEATGQDFIEYNGPGLAILVPHAQPAGSEQASPLMTGALVVRRGLKREIIGTGVVEAGPQLDRPNLGLISVTRLGLIDPTQSGRTIVWETEEVSPPSADELIALLIPRS